MASPSPLSWNQIRLCQHGSNNDLQISRFYVIIIPNYNLIQLSGKTQRPLNSSTIRTMQPSSMRNGTVDIQTYLPLNEQRLVVFFFEVEITRATQSRTTNGKQGEKCWKRWRFLLGAQPQGPKGELFHHPLPRCHCRCSNSNWLLLFDFFLYRLSHRSDAGQLCGRNAFSMWKLAYSDDLPSAWWRWLCGERFGVQKHIRHLDGRDGTSTRGAETNVSHDGHPWFLSAFYLFANDIILFTCLSQQQRIACVSYLKQNWPKCSSGFRSNKFVNLRSS